MNASTLINMWEGFSDLYAAIGNKDGHLSELIHKNTDVSNEGQLGFQDALMSWAEAVDKAISQHYLVDEFPGVWAYAVPELIGRYICEKAVYGEIDVNDLVEYATHLTTEWVESDDTLMYMSDTELARQVIMVYRVEVLGMSIPAALEGI